MRGRSFGGYAALREKSVTRGADLLEFFPKEGFVVGANRLSAGGGQGFHIAFPLRAAPMPNEVIRALVRLFPG
jgi:hypothetical protein